MANRVHPVDELQDAGVDRPVAARSHDGLGDMVSVPSNRRRNSDPPAVRLPNRPASAQANAQAELAWDRQKRGFSPDAQARARRRSSLGDTIEQAAAAARSSIKTFTSSLIAGREFARLGVMRQLWRSKTEKILQETPPWLTPEIVKRTKARLHKLAHSKHVSALRAENSVRQTEQETWSILIWALQNPDEAFEPLDASHMGHPELEEIRGQLPANLVEKKMFDTLRARQEEYMRIHGEGAEVAAMVVPGPVGDTPMHQCFLLGMVDLGKKVVQSFYFNAHLMNTAYANDMAVWMHQGVINRDDDDGGLYAGQTVLHIAINLKNYDLVRFLLHRGADIVARATGAFFSPPWIRVRATTDDRQLTARQRQERPIQKAKGRWRKFLEWVRGVEADRDAARIRYRFNENSACYYGEFPLSFAASLGEPAACSLLCAQFDEKREANDKRLMEFYDSLALRRTHEGSILSKAVEGMKVGDVHPAWRKNLEYNYFTNAQDRFGNTALHMAVMHAKKETIEWLCVHGDAQPSLDILNEEGYTPLTLAVKNRNAKMFSFVLRQIRLCSWTFGGIQMVKTPLDQIDTFRIPHHPLHSAKRWRSALEIIVENEVEEFAHEEMVNNLVMDKWQRFGLRVYVTQFLLPYFIYLICLTVCMYLRAEVTRAEVTQQAEGRYMERAGWSYAQWMAFMWRKGSDAQNKRLAGSVIEIVLVVLALPRLFKHGWQARRLKQEDLDPRMEGGVGITQIIKFVHKNLLSALLVVVAITSWVAVIAGLIHKAPFGTIEMQALSVCIMLMWSGLLICIMPFKFFGVLVITMWQMLTDGVFKFIVTYIVMVAAFSQSLYALFQLSDIPDDMAKYDDEPGRLFIKFIWVSLGDTRYMDLALASSPSPEMSLIVYLIYLVLVMVLMLNLLIAMMGKAFQTYMANAHMTWFFPFAHLVFRLERTLSDRERVLFRAGRPGNIMDPSSERFGSAIFYDIRTDREETVRKHAKKKKGQKRERLVLQTLTAQAFEPLEQCQEALAGIAESFKRIQDHVIQDPA